MVDTNSEHFLSENLSNILSKNGIDTTDAKFCIINELFGKKTISLIPLNSVDYIPTYSKLEMIAKIKNVDKNFQFEDVSFEYLVYALVQLHKTH